MKNSESIMKNGTETSINQNMVEAARENLRVLEEKTRQAEIEDAEVKQVLMEAQLKEMQKETHEQEANQTKEQIEAIAER